MTSILPNELLSFDYYKNKLPLYLQNSHGFETHLKIWYELLAGNDNEYSGIVPTADGILALLNIFDPNYESVLEAMSTDDNTTSDMLDKLGNLFGIKRTLTVTYSVDDETFTEQLSLDDHDFSIFVKSQIITNYCEGTYEQLNEYYKSVGLQMYILTDVELATSILYLITIPSSIYEYSENLIKLFLAGMLRVESMGIEYKQALLVFNEILIFDKEVTSEYLGWDSGAWIL